MKIGTILAILKAVAELVKFLAGLRERRVESTAETARAEAEALDHDALQKEQDTWTVP